MKTFLSIDWDYFIGASANERILLFPDGGNENLQRLCWILSGLQDTAVANALPKDTVM